MGLAHASSHGAEHPNQRRPGSDVQSYNGTSHPQYGEIALLFNERAHLNQRTPDRIALSRIRREAPETQADLDTTLASFAQHNIGTIIIDGGDGTLRDVLSLAARHFTERMPRIAIIPSGKTNALAHDIGIGTRWTARDLPSTLCEWDVVQRAPLEIRYGDDSEARLRGFMFGTGAFVRATSLAQSVHRGGAFQGLGVGLALAGAIGQTLFGAETSAWRRGEAVTLDLDGQAIHREFYILLASTLERLPLGLRPFGRVRSGLKLLGVDAPPRKVLLAAAAVLAGSERQWLSEAGCKRADTDSFRLCIDGGFVLDGEVFPGGELTISRGAPIEFLVPA